MLRKNREIIEQQGGLPMARRTTLDVAGALRGRSTPVTH